MPDTTSPLGFPFPLATEPIAAGYQNIEDLAEAVESSLEASLSPSAVLTRSATQTITSFGLIVFDGNSVTSHWSAGGGGLEYTGPDIWVMAHAQVQKQTATDITSAYIEHNGFAAFPAGPTAASGFFSFQTSGLLAITSGDTIAFGVSGSSVITAQCRIKSLGLAGA